MNKEWLTDEETKTCPICKSKQISEDKQSQAGTHCYTIRYECGAEVVK